METEDHSAVVCMVKNSGPSKEPCGTPYQSVIYLTQCTNFLQTDAYFLKRRKPNLCLSRYFIPI